MRDSLSLVGVVLLCLAGCKKSAAPRCFDVAVGQNSAATTAEFSTRQCQGGGVTWAALLHTLAQRRGKVSPDQEPVAGWTGDVLMLDGRTRFSIDEEGDAARFCTDDPALSDAMRAEVKKLNGDLGELRRAMSEAHPLALECLSADGGVPALPDDAYPVPSPPEP